MNIKDAVQLALALLVTQSIITEEQANEMIALADKTYNAQKVDSNFEAILMHLRGNQPNE